MKPLGALAGAILSPLVLVLVFGVLYRAPRENWDHGSPMAVLIGMACLVPLGAIAGYLVAEAIQRGRSALALKVASVVVVLSAAPAIYVAAYPRLPQPAPRAANEAQRVKWRERHGPALPEMGWSLAASLEGCLRHAPSPVTAESLMRGDDCASLRRYWYGAGPDSIAAQLGYQVGDDGWRWEFAAGAQPRAVVFPDPIFGQVGPIYEAMPGRIVERADREAPAFSTDRVLSDLEKSRECIARRAAVLRASRQWDGYAETLPALLAQPETVLAGCPQVAIDLQRDPRPGVIHLKLSGSGLLTTYEIAHHAVDGGYEWSFRRQGRAFLIDREGRWHARHGTAATKNDPGPEPCELDLTVPCE